jgi:hypothetical protein
VANQKPGSRDSLEFEGGAKSEDGNSWFAVHATGRNAAYILVSGAGFFCLYSRGESIPGPVVAALLCVFVVGIMMGIDVSGSQVRSLNDENKRLSKEVDRIAAQRDELQKPVLKNYKSSKEQ